MDAARLMGDLASLGVRLSLHPTDPDRLRFRPPTLDPAIVESIRENKAGLLAILRADAAALRAWAEREVRRLRETPHVEPGRAETPAERRERLRRVWAAIDAMDREGVS